jgi:hypothetical protein
LYQSFSIATFVAAAFADVDNTTVQFTWSDLTPNATTPVIYQLNSNASNVGTLTYQSTVHFAQRVWSYEFTNLVPKGVQPSVIESSAIVAALIVSAVAVVLFAVVFVRNRYVE